MKKFAVFFVALGAISYAVPGTLYKLGNEAGINSAQLVTWLFITACVVLNVLGLAYEKAHGLKFNLKDHWQIILAGTTMAVTNTFYMTSLKFTSVAVVAVMTMQSVWLAIVFGAIKERQFPPLIQIIGVLIILFGTTLAAGLFPLQGKISLIGMGLSFGSAVAYALTIQFTGHMGQDLPGLTKARLMSIGALILILIIWGPTLLTTPHFFKALPWGATTAIFAMLIPLTMFSAFMKDLSLGVGPILSALELPSSIIFAYLFLGERVNGIQILGVILIFVTIVITNLISSRQVKMKRLKK